MEYITFWGTDGVPRDYPYDVFCDEVDDSARMLLSWMITRSVAERAPAADHLYELIRNDVHSVARDMQAQTRGHITDGQVGCAIVEVLTELVKEKSFNGIQNS